MLSVFVCPSLKYPSLLATVVRNLYYELRCILCS